MEGKQVEKHKCSIAADHVALADAVHGMYGRLLMLEARVLLLEKTLKKEEKSHAVHRS